MMHWMNAVRASMRLRADKPTVPPPRLRRDRSGTAIVEFALGSGVLLAAFSGTFEFGYAFIQYNKLEMAVAQAARYASIVPYDSATTTPAAAFLSAVQN